MALSSERQNASDGRAKARLRWFQFRLRTLLLLVTAVAALLLAWRSYVEPYRRQQQTIELVKKLGGRIVTA